MNKPSTRARMIIAAAVAVVAAAAFLAYTFLPMLGDRPTLMYFRLPT